MQYLAGTIVIFVLSGSGFGIFLLLLGNLIRCDHRDSCVMNHAPVSRKHLRGLYPFVFCEICWDVDIFIVVLAGAGHEKFGDGQHHVRLNVPAFLEYRSRWQIFRLAFSGACPHPSVNSRDLRIAQARIVNEFAHLRISMPGRHLALHYIIANGPRPRSRVFIGHQ